MGRRFVSSGGRSESLVSCTYDERIIGRSQLMFRPKPMCTPSMKSWSRANGQTDQSSNKGIADIRSENSGRVTAPGRSLAAVTFR
jgi:hypothetical protein